MNKKHQKKQNKYTNKACLPITDRQALLDSKNQEWFPNKYFTPQPSHSSPHRSLDGRPLTFRFSG